MFRFTKIGKLAAKNASEIPCSKLGIGFEKLDRGVFEPERAYEKLAAIGVKWVRIQSGWQRTECQPGVYDFAWLDSIVDNLIARGMTPWMCLCYGNELYDDFAKTVFGAVGCPPVYTQEQKDAWYKYVVAVSKHFAGRVTHYEIWNEPDGQHCWKQGVNATELGLFSIETAKALREGNPDVYVIGGAICGTGVKYLNEAFQTGMADYMDAISFHEYTYSEENVAQKTKAIRGLAHFYNPKMEVVQGESGSQSRSGGHGALKEGAWTPRKQAKQLLRHLVMDLLCEVKFTSYFSCVDMIEALRGTVGDKSTYMDYGYFGVLGADFDEDGIATGEYKPKPSYYALQNLASLLGGDLKNVDLPVIFHREIANYLGKTSTVACFETTYGGFQLANGAYALAYWKPENLMTCDWEGSATIELSIPGEVHLVDPMDGSVYQLPEGMIEADDFGGRILRQIPIRDYPMFLVFGAIPYVEE